MDTNRHEFSARALVFISVNWWLGPAKVRLGEGAETNTRGACAPESIQVRVPSCEFVVKVVRRSTPNALGAARAVPE